MGSVPPLLSPVCHSSAGCIYSVLNECAGSIPDLEPWLIDILKTWEFTE